MKIGVDIGHNCPPDTGAVGIRNEDKLTREVGTRVITKIKALGHVVVYCTPRKASSVSDSLRQRCSIANRNNVELFVSIHFNAFNGQAHGTEVFAISEAGRRYAQAVVNEIAELGYHNRGVKAGNHLYVLRRTAMPAILIECCFCDSTRDMSIYNPDTMAEAIVRGLTKVIEPVKGGTCVHNHKVGD